MSRKPLGDSGDGVPPHSDAGLLGTKLVAKVAEACADWNAEALEAFNERLAFERGLSS